MRVGEINDSAGLQFSLFFDANYSSWTGLAVYYATASKPLTRDNTTVTFDSNCLNCRLAMDAATFAVAATDPSHLFDRSANLPAQTSCPDQFSGQTCSLDVPTVESNDFVFVVTALDNAPGCAPPPGFTNVWGGNGNETDYRIEIDYLAPSLQPGVTFTCGMASWMTQPPGAVAIMGSAFADPSGGTSASPGGGAGRAPIRE
jgi:hypothetical protein